MPPSRPGQTPASSPGTGGAQSGLRRSPRAHRGNGGGGRKDGAAGGREPPPGGGRGPGPRFPSPPQRAARRAGARCSAGAGKGGRPAGPAGGAGQRLPGRAGPPEGPLRARPQAPPSGPGRPREAEAAGRPAGPGERDRGVRGVRTVDGPQAPVVGVLHMAPRRHDESAEPQCAAAGRAGPGAGVKGPVGSAGRGRARCGGAEEPVEPGRRFVCSGLGPSPPAARGRGVSVPLRRGRPRPSPPAQGRERPPARPEGTGRGGFRRYPR